MSRRLLFSIACGVCLFGWGAALAQNLTGRISGVVSDVSKSVIPGASVIVTNQDTGVTWKAATDSSGSYVFVNLPVGTYSVEVDAQGFRKTERTGYDLVADGRITADFTMQVGSLNESVAVTEVLGEKVNTVSGEVGRTIDSEQVKDLGLNGGNYLQLVTLIPGAAVLDEDQMATTTSLSVTNQSINGTRGNSNNLMVDGGFNLDTGANGSQIASISVEFIQQVKVQTSAFSAQYGRNSGASINVITKSGGNQFHGSLFEYVRNTDLDARSFFSPQRTPLQFNHFGWTFGGPIAAGKIKKGKLFFFAGEEWKKIRQFTSPTRTTLPTLAEMTGDFSDRTTTINLPGTKTPIPNKNITSLMTPDGRAIASLYKQMSALAVVYTNTPTSNNTTFQMPNPFDFREDIIRLDWQAGNRHQFYARFLQDHFDLIAPFGVSSPSTLPTIPSRRNRPDGAPQIGHTWTINAHLINEAKLSAAWSGQREPPVGDLWQRATYGFQFPKVFNGGTYPTGIPDITISNFGGAEGPQTHYLTSPTTDISFMDNLSWVKGAHVFKTGFLAVRNRKDQNGRSPYDATVAFSTSGNTKTSNFALVDAFLGNFRTYTESAYDPVGFFRFSQYDGYVMDSWRVARNFSIEVGLRYSHYIPMYTQANNWTNFVPALYDPAQAVKMNPDGTIVPGTGNRYNGLIRAGGGVPADQLGRLGNLTPEALSAVPAGAARGFIDPSNLWAPRFSFAWDPRSDGKTAIRGGFGMFYDRPQGNLGFSLINSAPFVQQVQFENGNLSSPTGGTTAALGAFGTLTAIATNAKVPYVMNFNLGVQRELAQGLFVDVTYAGNLGRHLFRQPDINTPPFDLFNQNAAIPSATRPSTNYIRPYLGYGSINLGITDSTSNYNALQAFITRRKENASFTVSYTLSRVLTDSSSDTTHPENSQNRHYNWGPASFDRHHIFVATYTYRIPLLRDRKGFIGAALGRWELSGIVRSQSGPPLTVTASTAIGTRRADYLGGPVYLSASERTPDRWFNTTAFAPAGPDHLGTSGVGDIVGPGLNLWDASVRKIFKIRESVQLRVQADAFNTLNHPNFRSLGVVTSSSGYGGFSATGSPRNVQLGARLSF